MRQQFVPAGDPAMDRSGRAVGQRLFDQYPGGDLVIDQPELVLDLGEDAR